MNIWIYISNTFAVNNFDILENYVFEFKERCGFAVTTTFSLACSLDGIEINAIHATDKERLKGVFKYFPNKK